MRRPGLVLNLPCIFKWRYLLSSIHALLTKCNQYPRFSSEISTLQPKAKIFYFNTLMQISLNISLNSIPATTHAATLYCFFVHSCLHSFKKPQLFEILSEYIYFMFHRWYVLRRGKCNILFSRFAAVTTTKGIQCLFPCPASILYAPIFQTHYWCYMLREKRPSKPASIRISEACIQLIEI